jgi:hypothetical protein
MYVCIMHQCFSVGTSYRYWLELTTLALGWDVTDVSIDSEMILMIDFVNLKINLAQSFGCAHKNRLHVHMFIRMSAHTCICICVCIIFLKN